MLTDLDSLVTVVSGQWSVNMHGEKSEVMRRGINDVDAGVGALVASAH